MKVKFNTMKKNIILYVAVIIILLKAIFHKKLGLNDSNTANIIYYLLLAVFTFFFIKHYKPKDKFFWIALVLYILFVAIISLYSLFF